MLSIASTPLTEESKDDALNSEVTASGVGGSSAEYVKQCQPQEPRLRPINLHKGSHHHHQG